LSLAFAETAIIPETVDSGAGAVMAPVGGVVSPAGKWLEVVNVKSLEVAKLFAASLDFTR
jgi:hypothetical protein